jgi:hypothetical protein
MTGIAIELDRKRNLRFSFHSLALLQESLNRLSMTAHDFSGWLFEHYKPVDRDGQQVIPVPAFPVFEAVVWACLRHEDDSLTVEQTAEFISMVNTAELHEKTMQAMNDWLARGKVSPLLPGSAGSNGGPSADTTSA